MLSRYQYGYPDAGAATDPGFVDYLSQLTGGDGGATAADVGYDPVNYDQIGEPDVADQGDDTSADYGQLGGQDGDIGAQEQPPNPEDPGPEPGGGAGTLANPPPGASPYATTPPSTSLAAAQYYPQVYQAALQAGVPPSQAGAFTADALAIAQHESSGDPLAVG